MIQVKNVQAKSRVKSKKRKKCRKFSGKIGGKFPEIFRKISNFSAEIFRLTSLINVFANETRQVLKSFCYLLKVEDIG